MAVEVGDEGAHLDLGWRVQDGRIDPRPGDRDHPQAVDASGGLGIAGDHPSEERLPDTGAADADDHDLLVRPEAELPTELLATLHERRRVESGDVAAERVVQLGPVADRGQARPEVVGDDVVRLPDEDRPVADPREALDVLDHLGVVVGREERLALAAGGHRQPSDEVGHPGEGGPLQLRVLVQVVVDVPRLVADDEVVLAVLDDVVEDHEVVEEDLVHPADRLERVQVVLGGLGGDVRRLAGQLRAHRVDPLAVGVEDGGDRVLGEPVDLKVGVELPQLRGDRDVPLGVPEADRRRDVEGASAASQ